MNPLYSKSRLNAPFSVHSTNFWSIPAKYPIEFCLHRNINNRKSQRMAERVRERWAHTENMEQSIGMKTLHWVVNARPSFRGDKKHAPNWNVMLVVRRISLPNHHKRQPIFQSHARPMQSHRCTRAGRVPRKTPLTTKAIYMFGSGFSQRRAVDGLIHAISVYLTILNRISLRTDWLHENSIGPLSLHNNDAPTCARPVWPRALRSHWCGRLPYVHP